MSAHNLIRSFLNPSVPSREDLFFPLEQSFDDFFNSFFGCGLDPAKAKSGYPRIEAGVEGENWVVRAAVPGVKFDALNVEIEDKLVDQSWGIEQRILKISGRMSEEYESPKDSRMVRRELRKTSFSREMILPAEADGQPEATLQDGILTLKWKLASPESPKKNVVKVPIKQA